MPVYDYDMLVIGSGPAGQKAAIQAAKLDKRVALLERKTVLGGVSVNTGTIPSKTFREAVLDLSGFRERAFFIRPCDCFSSDACKPEGKFVTFTDLDRASRSNALRGWNIFRAPDRDQWARANPWTHDG